MPQAWCVRIKGYPHSCCYQSKDAWFKAMWKKLYLCWYSWVDACALLKAWLYKEFFPLFDKFEVNTWTSVWNMGIPCTLTLVYLEWWAWFACELCLHCKLACSCCCVAVVVAWIGASYCRFKRVVVACSCASLLHVYMLCYCMFASSCCMVIHVVVACFMPWCLLWMAIMSCLGKLLYECFEGGLSCFRKCFMCMFWRGFSCFQKRVIFIFQGGLPCFQKRVICMFQGGLSCFGEVLFACFQRGLSCCGKVLFSCFEETWHVLKNYFRHVLKRIVMFLEKLLCAWFKENCYVSRKLLRACFNKIDMFLECFLWSWLRIWRLIEEGCILQCIGNEKHMLGYYFRCFLC